MSTSNTYLQGPREGVLYLQGIRYNMDSNGYIIGISTERSYIQSTSIKQCYRFMGILHALLCYQSQFGKGRDPP